MSFPQAARITRWLIVLLVAALAPAWPAPRPAVAGGLAACAGAPQLLDTPWVENHRMQYLTFDCPLAEFDPQALRDTLVITENGSRIGPFGVSHEGDRILISVELRGVNYAGLIAMSYTQGTAAPLAPATPGCRWPTSPTA